MDSDKLILIILMFGLWVLKIFIIAIIFSLTSLVFIEYFVDNVNYCDNKITYELK